MEGEKVDSREKWNRKYEERLNNYGEVQANERLKNLSLYFEGGLALDVASGLGGNSLFLAEQGFEVHSYDISEVGILHLQEQAKNNNLSIHAEVCDLTDRSKLPFVKQSFHLVVMTYYLDRQLFPLIKLLIKEKGYFFMETYYQSAVNGRISNTYKLSSQELRQEFSDWKIIYFEENELEGRQTILCQKP